MKLTKNSNKWLSFFMKHNCLISLKKTNKTNSILKVFYNDIQYGFAYIKEHIKNGIGIGNVEFITNKSEIPKPITFVPTAFPNEVRKHIDKYIVSSLVFDFYLFDKDIKIIFLTESDKNDLINIYNEYLS
jgi:hypothetical protein